MLPGFSRFLRRLWRSWKELVRVVMQKLLRLFLIILPIKKNIQLKKGFVLPTATLVLLVVSLLVGALIVRTGQEAERAISQQAQQEIYNAATPAIERAKAKIEFLFRKDNRFKGIPSEEFLNSMMLNNGGIDTDGDGTIDITITAQNPDDRYTFSDEKRLTTAGDGSAENAWEYETDTNGDGSNDSTVRYGITMLSEAGTVDINSPESDKANNSVVRSGPVSAGATSDAQTCEDLASLDASEGWYTVTGSTVRKNFQINAVVTNDNEANKAVSTLEVQQDRDLNTGNKWGAWYRYDLELTPFPEFKWNGAMHTEGSLILNNNGSEEKETYLRLISAPQSCLYTEDASEITMAEITDDEGITFQGQVMRVDTDRDQWERNKDDKVLVDLFPGLNQKPSNTPPNPPYETFELPMHDDNSGGSEDSFTDNNVVRPSQYMLDPVLLISENKSQARYEDDPTNTAVRDEDWEDNPLSTRIFNQNANQPFVDDTYRADDRWGPKPQYNNDPAYEVTAANNGTRITGQEGLTKMPTIADPNVAGLDGYWERRGNVEGMRIIVGESFQLGPPPPPPAPGDTPPAVQAGAIYHWDGYKDEPAACFALAGHPGVADSTTFDNVTVGSTDYLETDFFERKGTNGWEFPFYRDFSTDINDSDSILRKALTNLAHFSGDYGEDSSGNKFGGAFPPTQDDGSDSDAVTHPYPLLTGSGNFSNLRRAIDELDTAGTTYDDLSLADQTTLQTASCTIGMLAHNLRFLEGGRKAQVDRDRQLGFKLGDIVAGGPDTPEYPWLFYLFPETDHDHDGDSSNGNEQPPSEPYIDDDYIFDDSITGTPGGVNGDYTYQAISESDIKDTLALTPTNADDFVLPTADSDTGTGNRIVKPDGNELFVPFMDKAIYDDREKMDVRLLDIDLNLLRSNKTGKTNDDYWLPTSSGNRDASIVYAFREDAVREDAIARPFNNDWATCGNESMLTGLDLTTATVLSDLSTSDNCRMLPSVPQDPPLNDQTGVSVKPVDGYADPDRRPYGFRLKNGADISRSSSDGTGLSFITDQPVYIQGDFNKHTEEEFTDPTSTNFYDRSKLNTKFATSSGETWRSSEILADGITLLSEGFTDQAITDQVAPSPSGDIEVNSILVSALIPSQPQKYNGGIHNFPRFLEQWGGTVKIRGSFIQLNFSKYATGSWDQENLDSESPQDLNNGSNLPHYGAPTRNWRYDVGLQYVSPAPVAERFVSSESPRTETYRELPADDPYIQNLLGGTVVSNP